MKTEFAALVNPIFQHVLELDERLRRGAATDFRAELVKIRQVFSDSEQRAPQELVDDFAIARRALIYWTDEILNESDKNWGCMLEWDCFETDDRATLFYLEYKDVASRASADVLEVFYLAVVLGFKGTVLDAYARVGADNELSGCSTNEHARQQWAETLSQMIPRRRLSAEPSAVSLQGHVDPLPGGRRLKTALICTVVMSVVCLLLLWVQWVQS